MAGERDPKVLRLRKRHEPGGHDAPSVADGQRIAEAQSVRQAIAAGLIAIVLFSALWIMVTMAFGRVFPWMTLILGGLLGLAVKRAGQGIDWRFPALAALMAFIGSIAANVVVAASNTAGEFDTGTLTVLQSVTTMTWPVFFDEVMTAADFIFALFAAGIAGFYANRRLTRRQYHAYRLWLESKEL